MSCSENPAGSYTVRLGQMLKKEKTLPIWEIYTIFDNKNGESHCQEYIKRILDKS